VIKTNRLIYNGTHLCRGLAYDGHQSSRGFVSHLDYDGSHHPVGCSAMNMEEEEDVETDG